MNILFVIVTLEGGGAQKLLADLLPLVNKTDCSEVLVLSQKDDRFSASLKSRNVRYTFVPKTVKGPIGKLRYIDRFIGHGNFDIVHVHLFPSLYYCSLLKRFRYKNIPFLYTEHNTDNRRRHRKWMRPLEKLMYQPYDYVASISKGTRKELLKWTGCSQESKRKYPVIYNGISLEEYKNAEPYERTALGFAADPQDKILCMIGSFTEQKNHRFMVEVMKALPDNFKLLLLGEGSLEQSIKDMVRRNGLEHRIYFLGYRRDAAAWIKTSDIVVIPSKWEGFGLVAVEAMACGKQAVCSDVPGLSEVVGSAGIKAAPGRADAFANAVLAASARASLPRTEKECIAQASLFGIEKTKECYMELYKKCLKGRRA